jgi:hypothetical protein
MLKHNLRHLEEFWLGDGWIRDRKSRHINDLAILTAIVGQVSSKPSSKIQGQNHELLPCM